MNINIKKNIIIIEVLLMFLFSCSKKASILPQVCPICNNMTIPGEEIKIGEFIITDFMATWPYGRQYPYCSNCKSIFIDGYGYVLSKNPSDFSPPLISVLSMNINNKIKVGYYCRKYEGSMVIEESAKLYIAFSFTETINELIELWKVCGVQKISVTTSNRPSKLVYYIDGILKGNRIAGIIKVHSDNKASFLSILDYRSNALVPAGLIKTEKSE